MVFKLEESKEEWQKQWLETYPDYTNGHLPSVIKCSIEPGDAPDLPFRKILPFNFEIKTVKLFKRTKKPSCIWTVEYVLKNGAPLLPAAPESNELVKSVEKFKPSNTIIMDTCLLAPNLVFDTVSISYAVFCKCEPLPSHLNLGDDEVPMSYQVTADHSVEDVIAGFVF